MNQNIEVEAWLAAYDNPMKEVVRRVREIILRADPRIEEGIQSQAPTFAYRGDFASIFPESKKHASLMLPRGGEIPGMHPRLEGSDPTRRVMKISSLQDANAVRDDLQRLVRAWCDWRDAEEGPVASETEAESADEAPATKKAAAGKRAPAAKKAAPATKGAAAKKPAKKAAGAAAKKPAAKPAKKASAKKSAKSARPAAKSSIKPTKGKAAAKKTSKAARPGKRSR